MVLSVTISCNAFPRNVLGHFPIMVNGVCVRTYEHQHMGLLCIYYMCVCPVHLQSAFPVPQCVGFVILR